MDDIKFIFCVGAPGSKWTRLTNLLKKNIATADTSDETDGRKYFIKKYMRWTHQGAYFGPNHEFGEKFYDIKNNYTVESFTEECLKPFSNPSLNVKVIRCHWFSYNDNLNWLMENFKGHQLYLISDNPDSCKLHWDDLGGWKISYPMYYWYKNDEFMLEKINEEYQNILRFSEQHNITWYNPEWALKKVTSAGLRENIYMKMLFSEVVTDSTKWRHALHTIR
jgi:hypothetical protein